MLELMYVLCIRNVIDIITGPWAITHARTKPATIAVDAPAGQEPCAPSEAHHFIQPATIAVDAPAVQGTTALRKYAKYCCSLTPQGFFQLILCPHFS